MKGLLLKDIFNLRKVIKQYLLILAFFVCYCFFLKTPSFFPMMTIMSFSMIILTSMGYDEAAGFDKFALTLPVNREDLVRVKYVMLLLLLLIGFVVGISGNLIISCFIGGEQEPFAEQFSSILAVAVMFLLVYATMLPVVFKIGVERARMLLMICSIGIFAVIFFGLQFLAELNLLDRIEAARIPMAVGIVGFAAFYVLASYFISLKIIRKREW